MGRRVGISCGIVCLFLALASLPARAAEHWVKVRSDHFTVVTDASEQQAREIAGQFERMRLVFAAATGSDSGDDAPILVVAVKDRKAMQALEPTAYLGKGKLDLAGYFMNREGQDYVVLRRDAEGEHPYATIYHEYTHYLLRRDTEWLPLWLNEGFAEFYQNTTLSNKEAQVGQPSNDNIAYLRQSTLIPVSTLLKIDASSPYYHEEQKGSVFYAESWALVHYLITSDRTQHLHRLADYEMLLRQHVDPVTAGQQSFGNLADLDKTLQGYANRVAYAYFRVPVETKINESAFSSAPVSTAEADATRAQILVDNNRTDEAQTLLQAVLKSEPQNATAHEGMGEMEFRLNHLAEAEKWYGEAAQLNPDSYFAQYRYAECALRSGDREHDAAVEASLRKAIALNPKFAPAYDALANFDAMHHEKLDEAHILEIQAIDLEPGNVYYRLNTANALMIDGNYENALRVLRVARHVARNASEIGLVDERIAQMQHLQSLQEATLKAAANASAEVSSIESNGIHPVAPGQGLPSSSLSVISRAGSGVVVKTFEAAPKYPMADPTGPKHAVEGVVQEVKCYLPTMMTLSLQTHGKTIALYRNNYYKITFTAVNFTPQGDLHPCTDLVGLKARVEYSEVGDPSVAGQILSMQLSK